jgi:hypothetical protein
METIVPCVEYVESHLNRVSSDTLSDSDMLNMLGGEGGFQVDALFYLVVQSKLIDAPQVKKAHSLQVSNQPIWNTCAG